MRPWSTTRALLFAASLAGVARAEEVPPAPEPPRVEVGFTLLAGVGQRDTGDLGGQLARAGYTRFGQSFSSLGLGAQGAVGRTLFGVELRFDDAGDAPSVDGTRQASIGSESIQAGGGFVVYRDRRLRVFPWVAVGYQSAQVLAPPPMVQGDDDRVSESALVVMPALGFDTLLVPSRVDGMAGLFLGLRLGYTFAAPLKDWSGSALARPDLSMPGPSLRIVLGYRIRVGEEAPEDVAPPEPR